MIFSYLKLAIKVLRRRPFFTFVSLFGTTFTLVVLTVATAFLDNIFSPSAPESNMNRTLLLSKMSLVGPESRRSGEAGYKFLDEHARGLRGAERMGIAGGAHRVAIYVGGERTTVFLKRTDGEFWKILDFTFLEGGPFSSEDDKAGAKVAVINQAMRDRIFGGASALGKTIEVDGQGMKIVGVVSNVAILREVAFADIWAPIGSQRSDAYRSELVGSYTGIVLAKSKADFPALKEELAARVAAVPSPDPKMFDHLQGVLETRFESLARDMLPGSGQESHTGILRLVFALVTVLFMALPAINLINTNLSRILERAPEIGVRKAFGASSRTLVGQFLVENIFLALIGGALGWIVSALILRAINLSGAVPYSTLHLNVRVLAWGVLLAGVFGVFSGLYPAWSMSRLDPVQALRGRSE